MPAEIIASETPRRASQAGRPAEAALHDPAARQDVEAGPVAAPHGLDGEAEERRLVEHPPSVISGVGEEMRHPGTAPAQGVEDGLRQRCRGW